MFCSNCGKKIKEDSSFCPYCGAPVNNHGTSAGTPVGGSTGGYPPKNHRGTIIAICIIAAVIIIVCIIIGVASSSGNKSGSAAESDSQSVGENSSAESDDDGTVAEEGNRILVAQDYYYFAGADGPQMYDYVLGNSHYRKETILSITFFDDLSRVSEHSWDASADQDGSVRAWVETNGEDFYDLYVAAEGGIYANSNSSYLFSYYTELKSINFNNCFYTDDVTTMEGLFYYCSSVTSIDASGWNTSDTTDMAAVFAECNSLESLDISGWDTSKVTSTDGMFLNCSLLGKLDLREWDLSHMENMSSMFKGCSSLESLVMPSGWESNGAQKTDMFTGTKWEDSYNFNDTTAAAADAKEDIEDIKEQVEQQK